MPDRLANYVPVSERLTQAQGEIIAVDADPPTMLNDVMGFIRVAVYLSDGRKATGTASFRLDLTGKSAQATNPIEDCETSALGRALAMLGYSASKSIASRDEVREAQRRQSATYERTPAELADAIRELWSREKALDEHSTPPDELATDLETAPVTRLKELGRNAQSRLAALRKAEGRPA